MCMTAAQISPEQRARTGPRHRRLRAQRVALRDGTLVTIREVTAGDEQALEEFLSDLCLEARRMRFFSAAVDIATAAHWAVEPSQPGLGLIAQTADARVAGHAAYVELGDGLAEVAVEVADAMQGQGLGTILIERLARVAERRGVRELVAEVLPENRQMLIVFRDGFDARIRFVEGVERITFPTSAWRLAHERFTAAAVRAVEPRD